MRTEPTASADASTGAQPATDDQEVHDVVVVGARCAGAATAMLLARSGHDVVLVDRARFPSDTLSTHSIARSGVVQLHRWGLLDRVLESGAPPIRRVSFHSDEGVVTRTLKDRSGVDLLVAPRRHILDAILLDAAAESGATVRTGVTVTDVDRDVDGRVNGVVGRDADGGDLHLRARFVVGADGLHSRVARAVGAPIVEERHRIGAVRYAYVAGLDADGIEFHVAPHTFAGVFPTHDGECNVWVSGPSDAIGGLGSGADRNLRFRALLRAASPTLADRVEAGTQVSPVRGFTNMPNHLRRAAGAGWALVGDAGYFRDAVAGHGMSDAFRDAETLARSLDDVLVGFADEADALPAYEARRDADIAELFDITCRLAAYPPVDEFVALQKRLANAIEEESRMLAARPRMPIRRPLRAA